MGNLYFWPKLTGGLRGNPDHTVNNQKQATAFNALVNQVSSLSGGNIAQSNNQQSSGGSQIELPVSLTNGGTGLSSGGSANQILGMNSTGVSLEYKTFSGTSHQVTLTNSGGSVTFSLPQNIDSSSSPMFTGLTLSGITSSILSTTSGGVLEALSVGTGLSLSSNTLSNSGVLSLTGTANEVIVSGSTGAITLSGPQPLGTSNSPTFSSITLTTGTLSSTPVNGTDIAIKSYVDSVAAGIDVRASVRVASTAALTATYSNGSSGVGATLTNSGTQAALTIDGIALNLNDRVLYKDSGTQAQNGIYTVTTQGSGSTNWVLTRSTDCNSSSNIVSGMFSYAFDGTVNKGNGWVMTTDATVTVGTTNLVWTQFTGVGDIIAGTGVSISGNTISIGQAVGTGNSPTFSGLTVSSLTSSILSTNGSGALEALAVGTGLTLSSNTLAIGQSVATSASPTFSNVTLSSLASCLVSLTAGGVGEAASIGTGVNFASNTLSIKRKICIDLAFGWTAVAGADSGEFPLPYDYDGTTSITWTVKRITLRVQTAGGAPAVTVEVSTASTAFSAATVGTVTLSSGAYQGSITSGFTTSTVASGNLLRLNVGTLATALNWTVTVEMEQG